MNLAVSIFFSMKYKPRSLISSTLSVHGFPRFCEELCVIFRNFYSHLEGFIQMTKLHLDVHVHVHVHVHQKSKNNDF